MSRRSAHRRLAGSLAAVLASLALLLGAHAFWGSGHVQGWIDGSSPCPDCSEQAFPDPAGAGRSDFTHQDHGVEARNGHILAGVRDFLAELFDPARRAHAPDRPTADEIGAQCGDLVGDACTQRLAAGHATRTGPPARLGQSPSAGQGVSIKGRVMSNDGLGLPDITVTLETIRTHGATPAAGARSDIYAPATVTDSSGGYEFSGLSEGDYEVRTAAHGRYGTARLAARAGVDNADIVLSARVERVIRGYVTGIDGAPLESVSVLPLLTGVPSVTTDAHGAYRLPVSLGTRAANVKVRFQLAGFLDHEASVRMGDGAEPNETLLNARMQPVEYWTRVSGTVTSTEGSPLSGRTVELRQVGGQRTYRATTDRRGHYAFDAVEAPVSYDLSVSGGPDHQDFRRRIDVTRSAAKVDVTVKPYQFGTLSGRLVNAEGAPVSDFDLVLRNTGSVRANAVLSSDAEGRFEVARAPAGELVLASQSSPSILVKGLRLAPDTILDVPVVLDWGRHELSGLVVDRNDNPIPAARVLLAWSHQQGAVTTMTLRRTTSDASGAFSFAELGPGPHVLQIDQPGRRPLKVTHDVTRQGYFVKVNL